MIKTIIAVLVGVVVMIVVMNTVDKISGGTTTNTSETTDSSANTLKVSIDGEINKKGTYYINDGGTLADLITAAGGVTSNADEKAYNLDYTLSKNMDFYIAPIYENGSTCSQEAIEKVNINTASSEELIANKNFVISSTVANNIVSYRNEKGEFKRIEDVINVSYVGQATFSRMKKYITIK